MEKFWSDADYKQQLLYDTLCMGCRIALLHGYVATARSESVTLTTAQKKEQSRAVDDV